MSWTFCQSEFLGVRRNHHLLNRSLVNRRPLYLSITKILAYFLKILHIKFLPRLLFMARANPSLEDSQDRTPIYLAAERGHTQAVDYLADKFKVICKSFVKQWSLCQPTLSSVISIQFNSWKKVYKFCRKCLNHFSGFCIHKSKRWQHFITCCSFAWSFGDSYGFTQTRGTAFDA